MHLYVNEVLRFFNCDEENKMNVLGKNKTLEEKVEELVGEIERMGIEVRNMKA